MSEMDREVIRQIPLVDQVYKDIKEKIVTGKFGPNAKLVTRELCERYGISDTPLKQALNRLVSEGLVEAQHRRGMRVKQMTQSDIHESIEARTMIELYAIAAALENVRRGGKLLERLEEHIRADEALIHEAKDLGNYSELAQRQLETSLLFHTDIVATTGNKLIVDTYRNVLNHTYFYYQSGTNRTNEAVLSAREHRRIMDCLRALDEEGARKAIRGHLQIREKAVTAAFGKKSG